jgi:hypothetical protein
VERQDRETTEPVRAGPNHVGQVVVAASKQVERLNVIPQMNHPGALVEVIVTVWTVIGSASDSATLANGL